MSKPNPPSSTPADPTQWSEESKRSVAYEFRREYKDIPYRCWHCKADCVFTALDQKYTYEVKNASINQGRRLCLECWAESHKIRAKLQECEEKWAQSKVSLQSDRGFLASGLTY